MNDIGLSRLPHPLGASDSFSKRAHPPDVGASHVPIWRVTLRRVVAERGEEGGEDAARIVHQVHWLPWQAGGGELMTAMEIEAMMVPGRSCQTLGTS